MVRHLVLVVAAVTLGSTANGSIIQWSIADGGNGNFYEQIVTPGVIRDWAASKADAEAMVNRALEHTPPDEAAPAASPPRSRGVAGGAG